MLKRNWMVLALCALVGMGGMMVGCSDDTKSEEQGEVTDGYKITLDKLSYGVAADGFAPVTISYMLGTEPVKGEALKVVIDSVACASSSDVGADGLVTTGSNGKLSIQILGKDQNGCETKITVSDPARAEVVPVSATIKVAKAGEQVIDDEPDPVVTKLEFSSSELTIPSGLKDKVDLLTDSTVTGSIKVESANASCARPSLAKVAITNGKGEMTVEAVSTTACSTTITAKSGDKTAVLNVKVTESNFIQVNVNDNQLTDVDYVVYVLLDQSCDEKFTDDIRVVSKSLTPEELPVEHMAGEELLFGGIDPETTKAVAVIASNDNDVVGHPRAWGCGNVSDAQNKVLNVSLNGIPREAKGTYDFVANYDFSSGLERACAGKLGSCVVENYQIGDWVDFLIKDGQDFQGLLVDPTGALIDFIWANSLDRIRSSNQTDSEFVKFFSTILNSTKEILTGDCQPGQKDTEKTLKCSLDEYLSDKTKTDSGISILDIVKTVSKDVSDLVQNMQFVGKYQITEVGDFETVGDHSQAKVSGSETYTALQYQWSLSYATDGCRKAPDVYGNSECRKLVPVNGNMGGTWDGTLTLSGYSGSDSLKIEQHSLNLKWATLLFDAIFRSILPQALGYSDYDALKPEYCESDDPTKQARCLPVKAFLDYILFRTVTNVIVEKKGLDFNNFVTKSTNDPCKQFLEALFRMITSANNVGINLGINLVGELVCVPLVGQADAAITKALEGYEFSGEGLLIESDTCNFYHQDSDQYQQIANPDKDPFYTVNGALAGGENKSDRCKMTLQMGKDTENNKDGYIMYGLMHAERKASN